MLDDPKSQAIFQALRSGPGLSSPAATKALDALDQANGLKGRFTSLSSLPADGPIVPGVPSVKIPPKIRAAAEKFGAYRDTVTASGGTLGALGGAIDKRMEDVTSKFAVFGVAAQVAQKMGGVPSGCGPLGAAFGVLTSTSRTDMLSGAMELMGAPLSDMEALVAKYANSLTGVMSLADEGLLHDLLGSMDGISAQITAAYKQVQGLVDEAEAMWANLQTTFNQAIQASILSSIINNPCLRDVADAVMPDNVKSVIDGFS